MVNKGLMVPGPSNDEYETPPWLFRALHTEFGFTVDACATEENAKLPKFWTAEQDGLRQPWDGERLFINPPYSQIDSWVKTVAERWSLVELTVMLLPVRTDSAWFQAVVAAHWEVRWFRKRIPFFLNGEEVKSPRFASMLVVIR